ncbi:NAD(P)-dependent alcohol dehydrogenase [Nonomuraea typhae]|uniref:NAD(P)-dependent alcohol dehydrogenase n=1 Tax=Nonomuraea typhae TaxID=2603600 RepID=UPI0012FC3877|nr:NAD(P)-dependent alcohol dehydrogenase [Nonomuraea typhae]
MKAFVLHKYGPPDNLTPADLPIPQPGKDEVLVRVRAASVQPYDWHFLRGEPYLARLMPGGPGLRKPSIPILGADISGTVSALGPGVTGITVGDEVFAMPKQGGFAQYAIVHMNDLAPKPAALSYEQAAAVPLAACTALLALRDQGRLEPGQNVLINGASGGVGTFAVQLAKALGAKVTAVCSTRNVSLVHSLGAAHVIDYTKTNFTREPTRYDLLVDIAGTHRGSAARRVLTRKGTLVIVGGPPGRWFQPAAHAFATLATAPFASQRVVLADVIHDPNTAANLRTLTPYLEDGRITPVVDRVYPFDEIPAAMTYQEQGHAPGKVVITI